MSLKLSRTALRELTRLYRGVLIAAMISATFVVTGAKAGEPITDQVTSLFGDVAIAGQTTVTNTAFGGRRMEETVGGKYRNMFPNYQMVGRSFGLSNSVAYVGPVELTLRDLDGSDALMYNYQMNDVDVDLAALAGVGFGDSQEEIYTGVAEVIGDENAQYTAPGVIAFANRDNEKAAGSMAFSNSNVVVDGATVNANTINVNGGSMTFVKQDASSLADAERWFTENTDISSDGKSVLNADTINVTGSHMVVNAGAELTINPTTSATFTNNTAEGRGGVIYNSGALNISNANFANNSTTTGDGGAIFINATDSTVVTSIKDSTFTGNTALKSGADSGAVSLRIGKLELDNVTFDGNKASEGGAIEQYTNDNYAIIKNSTFTNNESKTAFGALALFGKGGTNEIKDTTFEANHANRTSGTVGDSSMGGGAIGIGSEAAVKITGDTKFIDNTSATEGGAIDTRHFASGDNHAAKLDIIGATFTGNKAGVVYDSGSTSASAYAEEHSKGGAISNTFYGSENKAGSVFISDTSFTSNSAIDGGAIYNHKNATQTGKMYIADSNFTTNTATTAGGAIYNEGTLTVAAENKDVMFKGNTANGADNDIYNLGTLNFNAAEGKKISLAGGIDGSAGSTVSIAGDVSIANALKNQTVSVLGGQLSLDKADLTGSSVAIASDATINTIDKTINDYSATVTLANGAKFMADTKLGDDKIDQYKVGTAGDEIHLSAINILQDYDGTKSLTVADGAKVTADIAKAFTSAYSYDVSGTDDGKVTLEKVGTGGLKAAVESTGTSNVASYTVTDDDESVVTDVEVSNANMHIQGQGTGSGAKTVTLNANLSVDGTSSLTIDSAKFDGTGSIETKEGSEFEASDTELGVDFKNAGNATLDAVTLVAGKTFTNAAGATTTIFDSEMKGRFVNAGILFSDPTTWDSTLLNTGTANIAGDTFSATGILENYNVANLSQDGSDKVTFEAGATITGSGTTNLVSGETVFNNTVNTNTVKVASGADFSGALVGGTLDTHNGSIDTITGSFSGGDVVLDAKLGTTNTIDTVTGGTIREINILGTDYGTADSVTLAVGSATLDPNVQINGMNYYTKVEQDGTNVVLSDKLVNTSTIRGTGDGTTTFTGDVVIGDRAKTTTVGTNAAGIALDNANGSVEIATTNLSVDLDESTGSIDLEAGDTTTSSGALLKVMSSATRNFAGLGAVEVDGSSNRTETVFVADATDDKLVKMGATYNGGNEASVVAETGDGFSQVTVTANDGLILTDNGSNSVTMTATADGLDIDEGLTVGGTSYGIEADGDATFKTVKLDNGSQNATLSVNANSEIATGNANINVGTGAVKATTFNAGTNTSLVDGTLTVGDSTNTSTLTGSQLNLNGATLTGSSTQLSANKQIVDSAGFKVDANNLLTSSGLTASAATISGNASVGSLTLGGTAVTSTAAELNQLHGKTIDGTTGTGSTTLATVATVTGKINSAAGDGLTASDGVLSLALTDKGGLQLDGTSPNKTLSVLTDETTLTKDATTGALKIANGGVDTAQLADGAVTANKIADGSITVAKMNADAITTSSELSALLADPTTASDSKLMTEKAVVTGISTIMAQKETWAQGLLGVNTTLGTDNQLQTALTGLGGTNNIASTTIAGALHELDAEKAGLALDNTFTGVNTFANANGIKIGNMSDTTDASYKEVALTTTDAGALKLGANTEVNGTLKVGAANAITGTENTLNMGSNNLTGVLDIASTALTTNATAKTVAIGGDDYTVGITGKSVNLGLDGTGNAVVSIDNNTTDHKATIRAGSNKIVVDATDGTTVTGNEVVTGTLTANGESKFGKIGDTTTYALDVTGGTDAEHSAVTANAVVAATQGVKFGSDSIAMTSVNHDAAVAAVATDSTVTTNNNVIASVQSVAKTRDAINAEINSALGGVFTVNDSTRALSYNDTSLTSYGFESGATTLTDELTKYAQNVAAATGTTFAADGAFTNSFSKPSTVNYGGLATNQSLVSAISQLDKNIGTVMTATGSGRTTESFRTSTTKTVNENLSALDATIGVDMTSVTTRSVDGGSTAKANSVNANLVALDKAIGGDMTSVTTRSVDGTTTAVTQNVNQNLSALDKAIGNLDYTGGSLNYTNASGTVTNGIKTINANIGAASGTGYDLDTITVRTASVTKNGVASTNSVNQNIVALNETIGDLTTLPADTGASVGNAMATRNSSGAVLRKPATVVEALTNIDATLGQIHGLKNGHSNLKDKSNLADGTTVEQHLVSLDDSVGDRTQFASARYISSGASVADAAMALDANLSRVEHDLNQTQREMKGGFAAAAAMAALVPNARAAGDTQISVGTGTYRGRAGMALGGFHYINDNVLVNVGASYAGSNSTTFKAGVTFGW